MTLKQALAKLESFSNEKMKQYHLKNGAHENLYGCNKGDIRKVAKEIKHDFNLAMELWDTENIDARFLAILIIKPKDLNLEQIDKLVHSTNYVYVADWFNNYILKTHPDREALREKWIKSEHPMAARAAWSLTAGRVARDSEGIDIPALLNRLENEMADAPEEIRWNMNICLAYIGIHHPEHRKKALEIGENLGVYRDYPTAKGCVSPFAPIWINEMVSRQV
ncbi:DNA alkylation repair protein [bacterium]|nr:DNA alkylation repair protein [bacterium]